MNKYLATAVIVLSFAPGLAFAGEGNGPDFPGLQVPNISVGASTQPGSAGIVRETISHRADADFEPSGGFPSPVTPDGIVRPGLFKSSAPHRSVTAMAARPQG